MTSLHIKVMAIVYTWFNEYAIAIGSYMVQIVVKTVAKHIKHAYSYMYSCSYLATFSY